jgi:uncharacterized protein (TIGR02001 family)
MKKIITTTLAAGLVAGVAMAEVSTTFDFANAYVFRGITLNDGAVFQPGIEATGLGVPETWGSVTVGAWGNVDLSDSYTGASSSSFQETDWYGSYTLPIEAVEVYIGYTEYSYASGNADKEANVGVGYDLAGVGLAAALYQGVGGNIGKNLYVDFGAGYDIEATEDLAVSLGARIGYADIDGGESGFSDYDLSIGLGYALGEVWSVGVSIAYIGQIDDKVLTDADEATKTVGYDVDVVGMLSFAAAF